MRTDNTAATGQAPRDSHGCEMTGWSNQGAHLRRGVPRVYRAEHGHCPTCGAGLSQFGECREDYCSGRA